MDNILLDFWGTLARLAPGEDFVLAIANKVGISKEQYLEYVRESWHIKNISPEEFAELVIEKAGAENFIKIPEIVNLINNPIGRAQLFPEVDEELTRLRKKNLLYLVSDTGSIGRIIMHNLGVLSYFSGIFLSNELGRTKRTGLYELVFQRIGQPSKECLVVGNSLESDYNTPRRLGARAILLDRDRKYRGFSTISSLGELK